MVVINIRIMYTLCNLPKSRQGINVAKMMMIPPIVGTPFLLTLNGSMDASR